MKPERWRRINELFHTLLEREPEHRSALLDEACAGDPELRREVETLLASHEEAGDFIEVPAFEVAADLLDGEPDEALVGKELGAYTVTGKLGQGGMGVVYLAEDTRLGRPVAIKALPAHLTRDEKSRARLRREARAAANLSDPSIATVHALEEHGDHLYIVYEYVEGDTLRDELQKGPLPESVLVPTALAIARALAKAHRAGVVHRDLKPENVIRTSEGTVKILDFGLASFDDTAVGEGDDAVTSGDSGGPRLTLPGMLLGTPAYMSPEQLRGRPVDFRSDLFSFGVLLFELGAGAHPFARDDPASTMARILEVEPQDFGNLRPELPPQLAAVVHKCLHKDPDERYQDTAEMAEDLAAIERERLSREPGPAPLAATESPPPSPDSPVPGAQAPGVDSLPRPAAFSGMPTPPDGQARATVARYSPLWWWRFHQLVVGFAYYAMLLPLWLVKERLEDVGGATWGATWAAALFFAALVPIGVAGILRIHLWFTSRYYPGELARQRRRAAVWIHTADTLFVLILLAAAYLAAGPAALLATILVGFGVGFLLSFTMIEPTTRRAAFPDEDKGV